MCDSSTAEKQVKGKSKSRFELIFVQGVNVIVRLE